MSEIIISENAFSNNILTTYNVQNGITNLTIGIMAFNCCKNLTTFNIPDSVTNLTICDFAFSGCTVLNTFTIPNSVQNLIIGNSAFYSCTGLKTFTIPNKDTIITISANAFKNCNLLQPFTIPVNVANLTFHMKLSTITTQDISVNVNIGDNVCNVVKNYKLDPDKITRLSSHYKN